MGHLIKKYLRHPLVLLITFILILIITWLGPTEKTLGSNLKLVLLHGAWVGFCYFGNLCTFLFDCVFSRETVSAAVAACHPCQRLYGFVFLAYLFANVSVGDAVKLGRVIF